MNTASQLEDKTFLEILLHGEIKLEGQFIVGYNYTYLVQVSSEQHSIQAVYKPRRGEQPLWDFPEETLAKREVAAYQVNKALGWDLVPMTVLRETGPLGPGSLQRYIEHDPAVNYFNFSTESRSLLRPAALFDLIINNADRKGGHFLVDSDKRIWLIDHGLCFHEEEKLRTVIWDFAGQSIPVEILTRLKEFHASLDNHFEPFGLLSQLLSPVEMKALITRCSKLISDGSFPDPPKDRRAFPFPPI